MNLNQILDFLLSEWMILIYECAGCALLSVFLFKFMKKSQKLRSQMESEAESEKKTKLDELLINKDRSGR